MDPSQVPAEWKPISAFLAFALSLMMALSRLAKWVRVMAREEAALLVSVLENRMAVVETKQKDISEDLREIKGDVKELLKR